MHRGGESTATAAELREAFPSKSLEQLAPEADDPVIRARDARVALLARKYASISTTEDDARLQILTQRLRRLSPRVTPEDLNSLSTMVGQLEEMSADLDEIPSQVRVALNPFVYPKARHVRRERPGSLSPYSAYKPYLQREFERKCIYCRMPDSKKDYELYGVDHYRPKSLFANLLTTYSNLLTAAIRVIVERGSTGRRGAKGSALLPNPCDHEMFQHLRFKGATIETSPMAGVVAEELMDLNDPDAVAYRTFILDAITAYEGMRVELKKRCSRSEQSGQRGPSQQTPLIRLSRSSTLTWCR